LYKEKLSNIRVLGFSPIISSVRKELQVGISGIIDSSLPNISSSLNEDTSLFVAIFDNKFIKIIWYFPLFKVTSNGVI